MFKGLTSKINIYLKNKGKFFVLLSLVAIVFMVISSLIFYQLVERQRIIMSAAEEDALWASYQLDREILKLKTSLELLNINITEQRLDESRVFFDILYSRINILSKGQFQVLFERQKNGLETLQVIHSIMDEMDTVLFSESGPINTTFLLDKSNLLLTKSEDFVLSSLEVRSKEKVENRDNSNQILISLGLSLVILIAIVTFIIYILFKQLKTVNSSYEKSRKLTIDLEAAILYSEQTSRVKSDFMATMSHEIRTPMNSIIGFSHLLLNENLSDKQADKAHKIYQSANSLLSIINEILDFSKIESGKTEIEHLPFSVDELLEYLYQLHADIAHDKGLDFQIMRDFSIADNLIGDRVKIQQICVNLIGNAIKFTTSGSVCLKLYQQDSDKIIIEVVDTGIGINEDVNIFDVFQQGDTSTTRLYGGTGLGLSISQKITQILNGDISYSSQKGKGTQFFVELPYQPHVSDETPAIDHFNILSNDLKMISLANQLKIPNVLTHFEKLENSERVTLISRDYFLCIDSDEINYSLIQHHATFISGAKDVKLNCQGLITPQNLANSPTARIDLNLQLNQSDPTEFHHKKILLAEDNDNNATIVESIVSIVGIEIDRVRNGQEAIQKATSNHYDLILMDIRMPVMNGYEACEKINIALQKSVPIILITADILSEKNIDKFANDVIFKPFEPVNLINKIRSALATAANNQNLKQQGALKEVIDEQTITEIMTEIAVLEEMLMFGDSQSDEVIKELITRHPSINESPFIQKALVNITNYDYLDALDEIGLFTACYAKN